jgi:hypothetical protein
MKSLCIPALAAVALAASPLGSSPLWAAGGSCSGVKALATVDQAGAEGENIKANGTWQVSGGAVGALVDIRLDADLWQSETYKGTQGTWDFNQVMKWNKCGHYSVRVWVYPSVDLNGHLYHCLDNSNSVPWRFDVPCGAQVEITRCDWECGEGTAKQCDGTCTGSASGGMLPYRPFWGVDDKAYQEGPEVSPGPFTGAIRCTIGQRVSFKVREQNGKISHPAFLACGAAAGGNP